MTYILKSISIFCILPFLFACNNCEEDKTATIRLENTHESHVIYFIFNKPSATNTSQADYSLDPGEFIYLYITAGAEYDVKTIIKYKYCIDFTPSNIPGVPATCNEFEDRGEWGRDETISLPMCEIGHYYFP